MAMPPDLTVSHGSFSLPTIEKEGSPQTSTAESQSATEVQNTNREMPSILSSAYLDLQQGPEMTYGPANSPEGSSSPLVMYGPMNNAGGEGFACERVSKDLKDASATPGQCGLYNLGNTCFMNAGLQSLMATTPIIQYFLHHQAETLGSHGLLEQFADFVSKFWSGEFSIIYPKDLKTALGQIHGQFKDYRQHDCQEFLALLLDTLNDQTKAGPNTPFFITHNDLNITHTESATQNNSSADGVEQNETEAMETFTETHTDISKDSEIRPMPLTELADSPDGELLEDLHLNNTSIFKKKLPSIEKFYAKETKTLNTNVLISEAAEDSLNFDSSKFARAESCPIVHNDIGVSHVTNEPIVMLDLKRCRVSPKGVKDVNIYADMCNKNVNMYCDAYEDTEKVKRSKFDTMEKNFQHQAFSKLNCVQGKPSEENKSSKMVENTTEKGTSMEFNGNVSSSREHTPTDSSGDNIKVKGQCSDKKEKEVGSGEITDVDIEQDLDSIEAVDQDEEEDNDDQDHDPPEKMEEDIGDGVWDNEKLVRLADKRWNDHIADNQSIIAKTFHGQYKSSVKCSECDHVSVTFEPFMYLSVPLPRANERQLCVMYISLNNTPTKYLITVDKQDKISKVKEILCHMTKTTNNVVMAEVLDHHVARIVDDTTMLRYINSKTRNLFAFEMSPYTPVTGSQPGVTSVESGIPQDPADVFSHVGTFSTAEVFSEFNKPTTPASNDKFVESIIGTEENVSWGNSSSLPYTWPGDQETSGQWSLQEGSVPTLDVNDVDVQWSSVTTLEDDDKQLTDSQTRSSPKDQVVTVDQWKSCSICLEELADPELLVHKKCGATFCNSCLEMSLAHYGQDNFLCPVCSCAAVMTEDFIQLADSDKITEERMLLVDITFCQAVEDQRNLIGHPHLLYLSSPMEGEQLYEKIEKIVPDTSHFILLTTDAQGSRCSRCVYTAKCKGCVIPRDGVVSLRPGDTVCVCLDSVQPFSLEKMEATIDHSSMMDLRPAVPLSIYDCIKAFTESEVLDKHNPWFCPRCQQNQCANKSMTVWKYPDVLIIHLKRFVYHDLVSVKVDSEVEYPLEGLNLSHHISGPVTCDLVYDLHSIVCHFGDLNSGHYTCFSKHPVDNLWYYYNDENVTQQTPKHEDYKNAYILMYHRRGVDFTMPVLPPVVKTEQE